MREYRKHRENQQYHNAGDTVRGKLLLCLLCFEHAGGVLAVPLLYLDIDRRQPALPVGALRADCGTLVARRELTLLAQQAAVDLSPACWDDDALNVAAIGTDGGRLFFIGDDVTAAHFTFEPLHYA